MSAPADPVVDPPASPHRLPGVPQLASVQAPDGTRYAEVRRALAPRHGAAWRDLGARWAMLLAGPVALAIVSARAPQLAPWLVVPAAIWIGLWMSTVVLFMHEAAHHHLHPDKRTNDRLARLAVCWLVGADLRAYRALHWQHHLHLGDPDDTEVSYHHAPTLRFAIETLLGIHALRVLRGHHARRAGESRGLGALALGIAGHALLLAIPAALGLWPAVAAWVLGVAIVFPYASALRTQLEHRSEHALPGADYRARAHGPVNRMFRRTPLARLFGAAGFDRHLLHHWDPSISYTRFDDLEAFLATTELGPEIEAARTTYLETWRRLARPPVADPVVAGGSAR